MLLSLIFFFFGDVLSVIVRKYKKKERTGKEMKLCTESIIINMQKGDVCVCMRVCARERLKKGLTKKLS